jgi:hypothetical protein
MKIRCFLNERDAGSMSILAGYISEADLAAQLNKSVRTLQIWRQQRKGPPWIQIGQTIHYPEDGTRAWLKTLEQQPVRSRRTTREVA